MKNQRCRFVTFSLLILLVFIGIGACDKDKPTVVTEQFGVVSGTVFIPGKTPVEGVTVSIGTKSSITNANGVFVLSAIPVGANLLVDFTKSGYIANQKLVTVQNGKTTYLSSTMFVAVTSSFSSTTPNIIYDSGAQISLPANAFVNAQGNAFSGTVRSEIKYFDPTLPECLDAFPGSFSGIQTNGTETMFESYGFISAAFFDASNPATELQLASGTSAGILVPIPSGLLANAPTTMPMWYYNETTGKWMEQGSANRDGNNYVGSVSHFTYWNFDHPITITDQSTLTGRVAMADSTAIAGAQVVANGISYGGYTRTYSDAQGFFNLTVKASAQVTVQAFQGVNNSALTAVINTPAGGGTLPIGSLIIANNSFTITGKIVNTSSQIIPTSYGLFYQPNTPAGGQPFDSWINTDANGIFTVQTAYAGTNTQVTMQVKMFYMNENYYSSTFPVTIPQPGQVLDLGTIMVRPAANLTGRVKDNNGNWLSEGNLTFRQQGSFGEGNMLNGAVDAQGYFTVAGPPSTTLNNMVASIFIQSVEYASPTLTMNFPASGQTAEMGIITVSPAKKGK